MFRRFHAPGGGKAIAGTSPEWGGLSAYHDWWLTHEEDHGVSRSSGYALAHSDGECRCPGLMSAVAFFFIREGMVWAVFQARAVAMACSYIGN